MVQTLSPIAQSFTSFSEKTLPVKTPPHNYDVEQALLGALLVNNQLYDRINEFLKPEHFADTLHGRIYRAISQIIERGQIANPLILKNQFDQDPALIDIGGGSYLVKLADSVVTLVNIQDYAKEIYDLYLRRQLINLGNDVVNNAFEFKDVNFAATQQIEWAEEHLYQLAETGQIESRLQSFHSALTIAIEIANTAYKKDSHITGVTTGFIDLDRKLGGFHPSDLIILAGRPSMGKTALATNLAFNAALAYDKHKQNPDHLNSGGKVVFFSLEMSSEQLATRILAEQTGISSDRIRRGELKQDDFNKFAIVAQKLQDLPLYIDDTPALTVSALRTRARRLKRQFEIGFIVIDYLQLMQPGSERSRSENRVQEVSEITRGLKALAKELNVPILALSQLSRAVETREDKRPQLADLRESGSIEQDSDVVMFIFREQYYHERTPPKQRDDEDPEKFARRVTMWQEKGAKIHNVAEVNIAKQRHGPIGTIELFFDGTVTKFDNLSRDHEIE
ncbi:MAG: replicative DNA helicase [Alphaproteobacteria bacterium]|nr:replicative DNA helicase [Alphaproteobacteria bacterium]